MSNGFSSFSLKAASIWVIMLPVLSKHNRLPDLLNRISWGLLLKASHGDGIGFDWKESPPRELPGPEFDSRHLQIFK